MYSRGETMSRIYTYEFPLSEKLARYNDQALIALVDRAIGIKPLAIVKHFKHKKLVVCFDREIGYRERKKLEEVLSNPPTFYILVLRNETEEDIKKRIAKKTGVEPVRVVISGNRIVEIVFDRPVDVSKIEEKDLRVRRYVELKPSDET